MIFWLPSQNRKRKRGAPLRSQKVARTHNNFDARQIGILPASRARARARASARAREGFLASGFGFRVSGFGFRVSGFGFRVSGWIWLDLIGSDWIWLDQVLLLDNNQLNPPYFRHIKSYFWTTPRAPRPAPRARVYGLGLRV